MELALTILGIYLAVGLVFGIAFASRGVTSVDPAACGAGWGFRLLIVPGSAVFWPMLALRWKSGRARPPGESNSHRRRARSHAPDSTPPTAAPASDEAP